MTLGVRATSAVRYAPPIFSIETRAMSRRALAYAGRDIRSAALSKNLLTVCFCSGYPLLRHEDEAAYISGGRPVLRRAWPQKVYPAQSGRCARAAASTFSPVAQLGTVLALREVKQRDPRDKAQRAFMPKRGGHAAVVVSTPRSARRPLCRISRDSQRGKHNEPTGLEFLVAYRGSHVCSCCRDLQLFFKPPALFL
jgi:hypothetical protein